MKKLFLIALTTFALSACQNANTKATADNNPTAKEDAPIISFERDVFDFGKIQEGEKIQHDFKFINKGKTPLIITDATATCGCTVPEIPKAPVLPGASAVIKVIFDSSGKPGLQDKVITVTSNANVNQAMVHIIGEVVPRK